MNNDEIDNNIEITAKEIVIMIRSLTINNFRSILHLQIDDFKKVNILTGKNNCGKTTVLESIFLLIGMSNPQLPLNIHNFRDLILTKDEDFNYLFNNLSFEKAPVITGAFDNHQRTLKLEPLYMHYPIKNNNDKMVESTSKVNDMISQTTTNEIDIIDGLKLIATKDDETVSTAEVSLKRGIQKLDIKYKEQLLGRFINHQSIFFDFAKTLETIIINKEMDTLIKALQAIEPTIIDLRIGTGGMIYADLGLKTLIPINLLGDGIRRILSILTAVTEHKYAMIFIDEIENGLHHSALILLWKAILNAITVTNVQLFIATHSYECIHSFVKASQDISFPDDDFALFRLERKKDSLKALKYNADMLISGIENEIEVR